MEGGGDAGELPPEVQAALDALHAERHGSDTAALVQALEAGGVELIVLKGVGTAALLPDHRPRVAADIDVLVRPGQGRRAAGVLRARGYRREAVGPHATTWVDRERTPVDLHVTLPRAAVDPGRVWSALAAHRTVVEVGDPPVPVPVLDASAAALHLAVHLTQSASGLRERRELERALATFDDDVWTGAARLARDLGLESSLAWALGQVDRGDARRVALYLPAVTDRSDLPARSIAEAGLGPYLRSSVSRTERTRALAAVPRRLRRRIAR